MKATMPSCRHCGSAIRAPFIRQAVAYCCERCSLDEARDHALDSGGRALQSYLAEALVAALDAREHETGLHSKRVACHTLVLARSFISDAEELQQIYWGALLHDIGKIGIPDAVLLKAGPLTEAEWAVMRTHPEIGYGILARAPSMDLAASLVLTHEERFDGSGYPRGLARAEIPLSSRLFAVIDALDAMTSDRVYRRAATFAEAKNELQALSGVQFDPAAIDAFLSEEPTLRDMVESKCGDAPTLERSSRAY